MGRRLIGGAGGILGGWFVRSWLKSKMNTERQMLINVWLTR